MYVMYVMFIKMIGHHIKLVVLRNKNFVRYYYLVTFQGTENKTKACTNAKGSGSDPSFKILLGPLKNQEAAVKKSQKFSRFGL